MPELNDLIRSYCAASCGVARCVAAADALLNEMKRVRSVQCEPITFTGPTDMEYDDDGALLVDDAPPTRRVRRDDVPSDG